jgi:hypothetical protein
VGDSEEPIETDDEKSGKLGLVLADLHGISAMR